MKMRCLLSMAAIGASLPLVGFDAIAADERFIYKRNSDRDLAMTIVRPPGWTAADRRPGFIFFYNGGWQDPAATQPQFPEQSRYFAARGMLVAHADYREKSKGGVTSASAVEDIYSAVRWLRANAAKLGLDPERIAAAAGSGSVHLAAAVVHVDDLGGKGSEAAIPPLPGALFMFDADLDVLEPAMMQRLLSRDTSGAARGRFPPTVYFYGARDALAPSAAEFVAQARQVGLPIEPFVEDDGLHGAFKFSPWLEKTTARVDARLRELGYLGDTPSVPLPSKVKPPGVDERVLANQARWLERHNRLGIERTAGAASTPPPAALPPPTAATAHPAAVLIYKTAGERNLKAVVHYPVDWKKTDRRPALLLFSGGGFNPTDRPETRDPSETASAGGAAAEAGLGSGLVPVAEYFTARGMVALRIDYRKRRSDGVLPDKAFEDACSAVRWTRQNAEILGIDPARVVACGGSSGGHLAASLAALSEFDAPGEDISVSRRPNALILHSPLMDFLEGGTRSMPFLAALNNDRALGERLSPARHWRKEMPPTLLFTGAKEPIFQALCDFAEKWKAAGQPIELVKGEGGHVYSLNEKFIEETLPRMEEFLAALGLMSVTPIAGRAAGLVSPDGPPPATYVYQTFGERELLLAAHYPAGWKSSDRRSAMLFFSGAHKVQPDANGKVPPLAVERAKLGLPVVNRGPGEMHAPFCDEIAKRGLVVLRVEYRTRGRDGVLPGEDIPDAVSAMRWVRRNAGRLGIDSSRVVAAGGSSGAYLAASLFAFGDQHPDALTPAVSARPDAIILNSPLVDWLDVGSMSDAFLVVLNGDKERGARFSPARYWRKDCPPTLVLVGTDEPPFAAVRDFVTKWKAAGAPVDIFVADGAEHGFFWKPAWIEKTLARTDEFLRAHGFMGDSAGGEAPPAAGAKPVAAGAAKGPADTAGRLAAMLARNPEADTNKDGLLTMEEAQAFRNSKQQGKANRPAAK